ncbi:flavin reductase family protein [Pontibacterium sp. N1Y112]|uniref:Flavin reductase family protein n=1 Tax=Pontibacterium sinense TaxID=2781979 RepID=A0A8J7FCE1_9GAMM|nr:flavin reductase family protein [Pontibacterium sinense]MBE9398432.1 flavin reductase family protein [Pontibacterium sinense]
MNINLSELSPNKVYHTMTQTVVPRPVAWVLSEHENGKFNLAPFSYFNAVCSNPPVVMLSIGRKPDGSDKDTFRNIVERKKFVIHLAHPELAPQMTKSAKVLPDGESELELVDMDTVAFEGFELPRLKEARIAFACELYKLDTIGESDQNLVFGKLLRIWLDDEVVTEDDKGRMKVMADKLSPLARLGGNEYVTAGSILDIPRES